MRPETCQTPLFSHLPCPAGRARGGPTMRKGTRIWNNVSEKVRVSLALLLSKDGVDDPEGDDHDE